MPNLRLRLRRRRRPGPAWPAIALSAALAIAADARAAANPPGPWSRTERREACASFDVYRQPWFGETHIHTAYSSDAVFAGTKEDPRGAYRFAKGEPLGLPPWDAQGRPTRTTRLRRPLDFTAVTDHAEQFGEMQICLTPGLSGYDSPECVGARTQLAAPLPEAPTLLPPINVIQFLLPYGQPGTKRFSWCGPAGELCLAQASLVWQDTQAAAEQHYDRTDACDFTTFVAYEWSLNPGGSNLHRNVIFRNDVVPALPTTAMEATDAEQLWDALRDQCLEGRPGCDALAIPHNPNASSGLMFAPVRPDGKPLAASDATRRSAMEPLVEISQHKGDSECRTGVGSEDELCGFEKLNRLQLFNPVSDPNQAFPPLNYVRNALKEGLAQEQKLGENPFRFGVLGATDDHNAAPGNTEERDFGKAGHIGNRDRNPTTILARIAPAGVEGNPGGLAVAWAEENSRDAIFAAMRRREVYGTSGTRPILRFFGGAEPDLRCGDPRFVEKAYRGGLPMGAEIGPVSGSRSPRFGVLAFRDPGSEGAPGARLQRLQIVKGWVDRAGKSHEKVFDVAGGEDGGSVDTATCEPSGAGAESLCAVWSDPGFDASERAFYYARAVEEPTCRWSTWLCNEQGVDCSDPAKVPPALAECCKMPKSIQERAWSSPIWYRPEGVASLVAEVAFDGAAPTSGGSGRRQIVSGRTGADLQRLPGGGATTPGEGDVLRLRLDLGAMPPGFDPAVDETVVSLRDDDEVLRTTIPAGTLVGNGGSTADLSRAVLLRRSDGHVVLDLQTISRDFGAADRTDHFIEVKVRFGSHEVEVVPLWRWDGRRLATGA